MRNYYYTLEHSGTKGMKWGRRLYQNPDGSLTPLGRAHYAKKKREADKKRRASLEKARAEKQKKAVQQAEKEKLLRTGTAKDILKYKGELTEQELKGAYARIKAENDLASLKNSRQRSTGKKFVDAVINDVVIPGVKDGAKQAITNVLKDYAVQEAKKKLGMPVNNSNNKKEEEKNK